MRLPGLIVLVAALGASGCDLQKFTADSTSKVLIKARPSLQMESDYEMAARALPASLKTVEGFWVVSPDNPNFIKILTEGYCQYGSGFVEDEVEQADIRRDPEAAEYHRTRATKMFIRCLNYALLQLGKRWKEELFGTDDQRNKLLADTGGGKRDAMMWVAVALGGIVNNNKNRGEILAYIDTVKAIFLRILELDAKKLPKDKVHAALPHIGMGMALTGAGKDFGGDPDTAEKHFQQAIELTEGKFLLAKVYYASRVHFRRADKAKFHADLVKVLETSPSIWPEQRLANEIAHRRATRYLKQEQELFP